MKNRGNENLKHCPFCGGIPVMIVTHNSAFPFSVACDNSICPMREVRTPQFSVREKAIAAWNKRKR
jgi:formate dehydrogenase maturation protein FdhE